MKKKSVQVSVAAACSNSQYRTRVASEGEEEGDGEGEEKRGVSTWMVDHCRSVHNSVVSDNMFEDYEFATTNTFIKPLPCQVDKFLRINNAEQNRVIKINRK